MLTDSTSLHTPTVRCLPVVYWCTTVATLLIVYSSVQLRLIYDRDLLLL